jgi:hypothetical protein
MNNYVSATVMNSVERMLYAIGVFLSRKDFIGAAQLFAAWNPAARAAFSHTYAPCLVLP